MPRSGCSVKPNGVKPNSKKLHLKENELYLISYNYLKTIINFAGTVVWGVSREIIVLDVNFQTFKTMFNFQNTNT